MNQKEYLDTNNDTIDSFENDFNNSFNNRSSNENSPEKTKMKKLGISNLNLELLKTSVKKKIKNTKEKNNVNDQIWRHVDNWQDTVFESNEGKILGRQYKIKNLLRKQFDFIDIHNGYQIQNKEKVKIHVQNLTVCSYFLDIELLKDQIKQLSVFQCPYVKQCLWQSQDSKQIQVITDHIEGEYKSLARIIKEYRNLKEDIVKTIQIKILIALNHLHNINMIHGDLSAENIFVNKSLDVKLGLPGLGFKAQSIQNGQIGNFNQQPPELFSRGILDLKTDYFSLGSLLQILLCGQTPLNEKTLNGYKEKIQNLKFSLNHGELWPVSLECKSVMLNQMNVNHLKRQPPLAIIKSAWLEEVEKELQDFASDKENIRIVFNKLKLLPQMEPLEFAIRRKLTRKTFIINKPQLMKMFLRFDLNHNGHFDLKEFINNAQTLATDLGEQNIEQDKVYNAMDGNGDGQVVYDEFISIMGEFERQSVLSCFSAVLSELDVQKTFEISTNDLQEFFRKQDVRVNNQDLLMLFDKGGSKLYYEDVVQKQFRYFFDEDTDQDIKEELMNSLGKLKKDFIVAKDQAKKYKNTLSLDLNKIKNKDSEKEKQASN